MQIAYSVASTVVQYLLVGTVTCYSYVRIVQRLQKRKATSDARQAVLDAKRRKTNNMLMAISVMYFLR